MTLKLSGVMQSVVMANVVAPLSSLLKVFFSWITVCSVYRNWQRSWWNN